jgi:hypothetical protein
LSALVLLRKPLSGPPKRRKQPERYTKFFYPEFVATPRHPWRGEFLNLKYLEKKIKINQDIFYYFIMGNL